MEIYHKLERLSCEGLDPHVRARIKRVMDESMTLNFLRKMGRCVPAARV